MVSFGECDVLVDNRSSGRARLLGISHDRATYPRLCFQLEISLHEYPESQLPPGEALRDYKLTELVGELRLSALADAVGPIRWTGARTEVSSRPYPMPHQLHLVCDLDWARLETVEHRRNGGAMKFWLVLWPTITGKAGHLSSREASLEVSIPRDHWLSYLQQMTGTQRSVVEILWPKVTNPEFEAAAGHIAEAQKRCARGDFDEAVTSCRKAIEGMIVTLSLPKGDSALETALRGATDERRAKAYAGIVSRLKELGNLVVHKPDSSPMYLRSEALFMVATTAHLLSFIASTLATTDDA